MKQTKSSRWYIEQVFVDADLEDWNEGATSQGMTAAIRNLKRQAEDSPRESVGELVSADT